MICRPPSVLSLRVSVSDADHPWEDVVVVVVVVR
jgi:hypothetical protein